LDKDQCLKKLADDKDYRDKRQKEAREKKK
jgi:hypothetical protein